MTRPYRDFTPHELAAMTSSPDHRFGSGGLSIQRRDIPAIIRVEKQGYKSMGLQTAGTDNGPIMVIMVRAPQG